MLNSQLYISRNESNSIKGILILLIILGHNYMISNLYFNEKIFGWLYSFHVAMFFIIPFFYNVNKGEKTVNKKFISSFKRIYVPYLWFYVIAFLLYSYYENQLNILSFIKGIIPINSMQIKEATGVNFLWFSPCFLIFSFIRNLYIESNKKVKIIIYVITFIIFLLKQFHLVPIDMNILIDAFCYFFIGNTIFLIHKYGSFIKIEYICFISFIGYTIYFFLIYKHSFLSNNYLMPLFFTGFLLSIKRKITNNGILNNLGSFSYQIYLIHFFINYAFEIFLDFNFINGIISYIITITLSYYISLYISKLSINKYIFECK